MLHTLHVITSPSLFNFFRCVGHAMYIQPADSLNHLANVRCVQCPTVSCRCLHLISTATNSINNHKLKSIFKNIPKSNRKSNDINPEKMLKVFADRMSQPSRAILIFCKANGIEFEEVKVEIVKGQHRSPEFKDINPMGKVPAITDGRFNDFNLFESHAIVIYLASSFPGVADSWYPADHTRRAKIHSVLDWHHSNLRAGAAPYVLHSTLAPLLGWPLNPQAAAEAEKLLVASLGMIESYWLKGDGKFLVGGSEPSIADLSLICEIMQLELVDEESRKRILGPFKKVQQWIESTRTAIAPHFDEVHGVLFAAKAQLQKQRS